MFLHVWPQSSKTYFSILYASCWDFCIFLSPCSIQDQDKRLQALLMACEKLPPANNKNFKWVIAFTLHLWGHVISHVFMGIILSDVFWLQLHLEDSHVNVGDSWHKCTCDWLAQCSVYSSACSVFKIKAYQKLTIKSKWVRSFQGACTCTLPCVLVSVTHESS